MYSRHRPNTEARHEFALRQQMLQDALQLFRVDQREQMLTARIGLRRALAHIHAVEQAIAMRSHDAMKLRSLVEQALIHDLACKQRNQTDPREHVDALPGAIGSDDDILEESVGLIPQRHTEPIPARNGLCDAEELHVALNCDVLVV